MITYPTKYIDKYGEIETQIVNDNEKLYLQLEGLTFIGKSFDDFEPLEKYSAEKLARFSFDRFNVLKEFRIICEIPVQVINSENIEESAKLKIDLEIGKRIEKDILDKYKLKFQFFYRENSFEFETGELFETGLQEIQKKFDIRFKNCFGCMYGDYFYGGQGMFGTMMCFKNIKDEYLNVKNKDDYMEIFDRNNGTVQELYLCEEYELRTKGVGYRG